MFGVLIHTALCSACTTSDKIITIVYWTIPTGIITINNTGTFNRLCTQTHIPEFMSAIKPEWGPSPDPAPIEYYWLCGLPSSSWGSPRDLRVCDEEL